MRDFNEVDRKKKKARIKIQENPGNLSKESLSELESAVKASLKDGYLSCPVAWGIAKKYNIPRIVLGNFADRLGIRVTNCQLGCFKIEKTPYTLVTHVSADKKLLNIIELLKTKGSLNCAEVFELATQYKLKPITIANEMSSRDFKIHNCQLGCF